MDCRYAIGTRCLVAERIAGVRVTTRTDKACQHCLAATPPAGKNSVTVSLAISSLHLLGDTVGARKILDESKYLLRTVTKRHVIPTRTECVHRGEQTRMIECPSCRGQVQVKAFSCEVFGECVLGKTLPDIACCGTCKRYETAAVCESLP